MYIGSVGGAHLDTSSSHEGLTTAPYAMEVGTQNGESMTPGSLDEYVRNPNLMVY